jgi:putative DNA primase/helicase
MQTSTNYTPGTRSELWERFLNDVFLGDCELIAYVQRALGYSITAETRERKIFICYGTGANGKTTLFEIVRGVMGDYVQTVPMWALRRDKLSRRAMSARAALFGVRLAILSLTTSEEKRLGKLLYKLFLTADPVVASYPYREHFGFTLEAKLWLSTNHKPCITDCAVLRRVAVIPFRAVFTNDPNVDPAVRRNPDPDIKEKLLQSPHREAIHAWLVEGARAWYREGLKEPDIVRAAVEECRCRPKRWG